jgi:hypothetical protein
MATFSLPDEHYILKSDLKTSHCFSNLLCLDAVLAEVCALSAALPRAHARTSRQEKPSSRK